MPTVPTQVLGQTSETVSLDTDALIAACQGAAWKIHGWPENIAIHHVLWISHIFHYVCTLSGPSSGVLLLRPAS